MPRQLWHPKFNFDTVPPLPVKAWLGDKQPKPQKAATGPERHGRFDPQWLCRIALMRSPAPRTANGAPIRELATAPIAPGNPSSMTIRDAVARKFARDLLTDDPELDVERFLKDCEALSQSP